MTHTLLCTCFVILLIGYNSANGSYLKVEAEEMDNVKTSMIHSRSKASREKSVFMQTGEAIYFDLCLMSAANVSVKSLTYSNDGESDRLEVAVDSNISVWNLETKRVIGAGDGWNQFITAVSNDSPLLIAEGRHRVTVEVLEADQYGVEIDDVVIEVDASQSLDTLKCTVFCFDNIMYADDMPYQSATKIPARAFQESVVTKCAEEDNINIPVFHDGASKFVVSASIPKYTTFLNNRGADWLDCEMAEAFWMFRNLNLGSNIIDSKIETAVLNVTTTRGFLMNENIVTVDVMFGLKGPSIGNTDSEVGARFNISGIHFNDDIRIDFQYFGRTHIWSHVQSQIYNGSTEFIVFETRDFTFFEGSGNRIKMKFITNGHSANDIIIDNLYMFKRKLKPDTSVTLFNDGTTVIEGVYMDMWWRINETMSVSLASGSDSRNNLAYVRIYRQVTWSDDSYSQVFVLYQDGNIRLLPLTPHGLDWIPFGSSVIIGQTDPSAFRPSAPISHLDIDPASLTIKMFYYDGGFTTMQLKTTIHQTELIIHESIHTRDLSKFPFFTFRSMWISDGNADVDHITVDGKDTFKILDKWGTLRGNFFAFYRKCISKHNTLSPDIRLKILS